MFGEEHFKHYFLYTRGKWGNYRTLSCLSITASILIVSIGSTLHMQLMITYRANHFLINIFHKIQQYTNPESTRIYCSAKFRLFRNTTCPNTPRTQLANCYIVSPIIRLAFRLRILIQQIKNDYIQLHIAVNIMHFMFIMF